MREEIVNSIRSNQVTIVAGETGSGKTTQLPLFCLEAGRGRGGRIGCTQPRRIAALSLAGFLGSQFTVPGQVGYKIRFREDLAPDAKIKFMTDGILLAEIAGDPLLKKYDTIIIDEAHERSINVDFLLGCMRKILPRRPDLCLIISSATIDTKLFSRAFHNARVISVSGRLFPVEIRYKPVIELWKGESMDSYIEGVVTSVQEIIASGEDGDILVFLPTIDDTTETLNRLRHIAGQTCTVLPLHSRISPVLQQKIFQPSSQRRIIAATNIAETSITVPGIRFVIDSGLARLLRYEPMAGFSRMPIEKISKASADQRAGRCGRVQDGICIRLYSEQDYMSRPSFTTPELRRANLSGVILKMLSLGFGDAARFPFLQHPVPKAVHDGYRQLKELGAIDKKYRLTQLGRKMALLPVDPRLSRILLSAKEFGAGKEILAIASALSVEDPMCSAEDSSANSSPKAFRNHESDFLSYLNLWNALQKNLNGKKLSTSVLKRFCSEYGLLPLYIREWYDAHNQLERICRSVQGFFYRKTAEASSEQIHKSLLSGLRDGIAFRVDNGLYHGINGEIRVFPASSLFRKNFPWVLFAEVVETSKVYGRIAAVIKPRWIEEIFRDQCSYTSHDPWFDAQSGTVKAYQEVSFKGLSLVHNRIVDLSVRDRKLAHGFFIREALVKELAGLNYRFLRKNRDLLDRISEIEHKIRKKLIHNDLDRESFYEEKLPDVLSIKDLNNAINNQGSDAFLMLKPGDLSIETLPDLSGQYPDSLTICDQVLPVSYRFNPEDPQDGATVVIDGEVYRSVPLFYWQWLLPVFNENRVERVLSSISDKLLHRGLSVADAAGILLDKLTVAEGPYLDTLCRLVRETFSLQITPDQALRCIPEYLWLNVIVKDHSGVIKTTFRPPLSNPSIDHPGCRKRGRIWGGVCSELEKDFDGVLDDASFLKPFPVKPSGSLVPVYLVPALCREDHKISVKTFFSGHFAQSAHCDALTHLLEQHLAEKLAWEMESFRVPQPLVYRYKEICSEQELDDAAGRIFTGQVLSIQPDLPDNQETFCNLLGKAEKRIPSASLRTIEILERIITELDKCMSLLKKRAGKYKDAVKYEEFLLLINEYVDALFTEDNPAGFIERLPSYLGCLAGRIDMGYLEPVKYRDLSGKVSLFSGRIRELFTRDNLVPFERRSLWELKILLEEIIILRFSTNSAKNRISANEQILAERLGQWNPLS